jgi:hypothetical protein
MSIKCEHESKKTLERIVINQEERLCSFAATAAIRANEKLMRARTVENGGRKRKKKTKLGQDLMPCIKTTRNIMFNVIFG